MNNDLISREALKKDIMSKRPTNIPSNDIMLAIHCIDNAPTVDVSFELKTENGITYPKALDQMTFTHELSTEEKHNIINAYMLGAHANTRPQGEWGKWVISEIRCPECLEFFDTDCYSTEELKKCPSCGATMKGGAE